MEGFISPGWAPALTGCSRRSLWRGTTTSGRQSAERKSKMFLSLFSAAGDRRPWRVFLYLSCKDPAEANDDQDVEDGRADDGADSDVSFGDEDPWVRVGKETGAWRSTFLLCFCIPLDPWQIKFLNLPSLEFVIETVGNNLWTTDPQLAFTIKEVTRLFGALAELLSY